MRNITFYLLITFTIVVFFAHLIPFFYNLPIIGGFLYIFFKLFDKMESQETINNLDQELFAANLEIDRLKLENSRLVSKTNLLIRERKRWKSEIQ